MSKVLEIWADTGQTIVRDLTENEAALIEADRLAAEAERKAAAAALEARKAPLRRLGLTEEEINTVLGV